MFDWLFGSKRRIEALKKKVEILERELKKKDAVIEELVHIVSKEDKEG